jgi:CubicO group peptidase (beta-lactamase class C family)
MALLGTMRPTSGFGEVYQYSNVLASAAGFIAGAALYPERELGEAYDEAMQSRIFGPLGMTRTTLDFEKALAEEHASPHDEDVDGRPAVAVIDVDRAIIPLRPSGGAWSSARDLRRYVQLELAAGKLPDGTRFVSESALGERRASEVRIGEDETYGMGLRVDTEYGVPYVHHGGGLVGYKSDLFWLPEQGVGGVILTNSTSGGLLLHPFVRKVLEEIFDGNREADEDMAAAAAERKATLAKDRARRSFPASAAVVSKLAPRYTNPVLGELTVRTDARGTLVDAGRWRSLVASRMNDDGTASLLTVEPGADGFEFHVDPREPVPRLTIRDAQHDYVFVTKP